MRCDYEYYYQERRWHLGDDQSQDHRAYMVREITKEIQMEDLIKRADAIEVIKKWFEKIKLNPDILIDSMISIPSADRPQGEWIDKGDYAECSNCGANSGTQFDGVEPVPRKTKFCPNCGARMKGADDE